MTARTSLALIAAAAFAAACSSSNRETRTASDESASAQTGATARGTSVNETPATGSATDVATNLPAGSSGTTTSTHGAIEGPGGRTTQAETNSLVGRVTGVDAPAGRLTLDRPDGSAVVIFADDGTDVVDSSGHKLRGLSGIEEGQQVRARLDRSSDRALRIVVIGQ